jgi:CheY-like chemotaxis protein
MIQSIQNKKAVLSFFNHELRTPVHGISGLLRMLKESGLSETQMLYAENLDYTSKKLSHTVSTILDYLKLADECLKPDLRRLDLSKELNAFFDQKAMSDNFGDIFHVEIGSFPKSYLGDTDRLHFIFESIINTFFSGSADMAIHFHAGILQKSEQNHLIHFHFKQDQTALNQEKIIKIEQECHLDLFVSQELINMFGGKLVYELLDGSFELGFNLNFSLAESAKSYDYLKARKILIAEDELVSRKVALHTLRKMGFSVDAAVNGRQAVDLFRKGDYDFILMDIQMPEMHGMEATKEIRNIEAKQNRDRRAYIVAFTADSVANQRVACLQSGMDDYMTKPFNLEKLPDVLMEQVRGLA